MTKDELKVGYGVINRLDWSGIVTPYDNSIDNNKIGIYYFNGCWDSVEYINNDLSSRCFCQNDIVKVYGFPYRCEDTMNYKFEYTRDLLWDRSNDFHSITDTAEDILMYGMEILSED